MAMLEAAPCILAAVQLLTWDDRMHSLVCQLEEVSTSVTERDRVLLLSLLSCTFRLGLGAFAMAAAAARKVAEGQR